MTQLVSIVHDMKPMEPLEALAKHLTTVKNVSKKLFFERNESYLRGLDLEFALESNLVTNISSLPEDTKIVVNVTAKEKRFDPRTGKPESGTCTCCGNRTFTVQGYQTYLNSDIVISVKNERIVKSEDIIKSSIDPKAADVIIELFKSGSGFSEKKLIDSGITWDKTDTIFKLKS